MEKADLIRLYPQLFHMASAGSWDTIREFGLRTTLDIVSTSGLGEDRKHRLITERRPASVSFDHPTMGTITLRDQIPLRLPFLEPKLTDMSVSEWIQTLNDRVFFWLHPQKLQQLLSARMYRNRDQDVITVDTASLLASVADRVRLSGINSGAALYPNAAPRGSTTFQRIADYDYSTMRRKRGAVDAIVELAVVDGVPDLASHVIRVERRRGQDLLGELPLHP